MDNNVDGWGEKMASPVKFASFRLQALK